MPPRLGPTPFQPILDELGLSSFSQYMKGTRSVGANADGGQITLTPYRNGGPRNGFVPISDSAAVVDGASDEAVGDAVLRALERCE